MAVKHPGQLAYWLKGDRHVIGQVGDKHEGWYDVSRRAEITFAPQGAERSLPNVVVTSEFDKVYRDAVRDIPDWLIKGVFDRIFRERQ